MKIAFIGIGKVGFAIADSLQKKGHDIVVAGKKETSETISKALVKNPAFVVKDLQDAIDHCDAVVLSIPFGANKDVLPGLQFHGKLLIDCTNPVGPGISHGLQSQRSGSEVVQELAPDAKVVKAFNIYGFENFANSSFPAYNVKPVMLMAGNDAAAKKQAAAIITDMGFFAKDTGDLSQALHLEHMTLLWVKMVRMNGHHPNFTWAYLER